MIWTDTRIETWYRQNILLFVHPTATIRAHSSHGGPLDIAHPDILAHAVAFATPVRRTFRNILQAIPGVSRARQTIRKVVGL
jgi:hypothetical protein